MNELDLAIAKIEGVSVYALKDVLFTTHEGLPAVYSPSANWRDCGPLIEKYKVNIHYDGGDAWFAWFEPDSPTSEGKTPQEAICRAILEVKHNVVRP